MNEFRVRPTCKSCHGRGFLPEGDGRGAEPCEECLRRDLEDRLIDSLDEVQDAVDRLVEVDARLSEVTTDRPHVIVEILARVRESFLGVGANDERSQRGSRVGSILSDSARQMSLLTDALRRRSAGGVR